MGDTKQQDIAAGELIDLELIRRFIVVAEELNFTRAAARLGMAQPPLSAAIGKLERKLGVRLLERTSRRVTLTPAGAVLLEQGRIAVEGVGAAIQRARRKGTQADRLTVAVKPGTSTDLLKKIMQAYAQDPRMPQVHLLFGHPGGPAAAVRGGAADVAILRAPFDQRGLDTELLLTEPRVAVLPAGHPLAGRPNCAAPIWPASRCRAGPARPTPPLTPTGPVPTAPARPGSARRDRAGPRNQRHQPAPGRRHTRQRRRLRADLRRRPAPRRGPGVRAGQRSAPQRGHGRLAGHQPLARGGRLRPRGRRSSGQPLRADRRLRLIPAI